VIRLHRRPGAVIEREVEDGVLLLDEESGRIHQLNETASFIWRQCKGLDSATEIASSVAQAYSVNGEVAARDVVQMLSKLQDLNLLVDVKRSTR
jgi:hypothetical protein